jgi:hypothetical protein
MRFKYCVAILLFVAVIGVVVLAAPAAAAKGDDSVTVAGPGGYVVTFYKAPSKSVSGTVSMLTDYSTITQGQYNWHYRNVNYYTTSLNFYLYWGNPSNSLRLRIFTPDGYVLGPFYDSYDGMMNGATGVTVSRSGGVAQGTWTSEVYGYSVSGSQSYSMSGS